MIEIHRMFLTEEGEIVFEDVRLQWWRLEQNDYVPERGVGHESALSSVIATKIDKPDGI